jgi:hypothetical protein
MHIEDFKKAIHESIYDENDRYVGPSVIGKQYQNLVKSNPWISMVDPSGGPYIAEGMDMKLFGMKGKVNGFINRDYGYEIITNK